MLKLISFFHFCKLYFERDLVRILLICCAVLFVSFFRWAWLGDFIFSWLHILTHFLIFDSLFLVLLYLVHLTIFNHFDLFNEDLNFLSLYFFNLVDREHLKKMKDLSDYFLWQEIDFHINFQNFKIPYYAKFGLMSLSIQLFYQLKDLTYLLSYH